MKILLINKFLYPRGGDAISTLETGKLLSENGHSVVFWGMKHPSNPDYPYSEYFVDNIDYNGDLSIKQKILNFFKILYSFEAKRKIEKLVRIIKPDIVHLNNFAHQISPSILHVFKKYNIPTVMTMHDYKLVCPSYSMLVNGKPCESCRNGRYFFCLIKGCVKNSRLKSLVNTLEMYLHHKVFRIYELINMYISPSKFLKDKVAEMGFKKHIEYLPNFVNLDEFSPQYEFNEESICYFGRFSQEKGLFTLLEAMRGLEIELKIIGDGPIGEGLKLKVRSEKLNNVGFLGYKTGNELKNEIKNSIAVVVPSKCYENNPRSVIEAFTLGKPVIGARIGGIPELVRDGETGLTFEPENAEDLKSKIKYLINNPQKISEMGRNARKFVEEKLNPEKHYEQLMKIYQLAMERCK